jgi:hypothetical protein
MKFASFRRAGLEKGIGNSGQLKHCCPFMGRLRSTSVENLRSRAARLGLKLLGWVLKIEDSEKRDAVATVD